MRPATARPDRRTESLMSERVVCCAAASCVKAFERPAGDGRDELEVLVDVQHGQPGKLRGRGDEQVGDGWSAVLPRSASSS